MANGERRKTNDGLPRLAIALALALSTSISARAYTMKNGLEVGFDVGPGVARNDDLTRIFQRLDWIFISDSWQNLWTQYRNIYEREKVLFDRPTMTADFGLLFTYKRRIFVDYVIKERLRVGLTRLENFGSDVSLRFYDPGNYDARASYYQDWSSSAVNISFTQYFGVGGEVWEAYIGYGIGMAKAKLEFEWLTKEGSEKEPAWYMAGAVQKEYWVEQSVVGEMSSAWGMDQYILAELNRKLVGPLYLCLEAQYHWLWLEDFSGQYSVSYTRNGEEVELPHASGEGTLLILEDVIGIQPIVIPNSELDQEPAVRPLVVDFVGPRLMFSLRLFF